MKKVSDIKRAPPKLLKAAKAFFADQPEFTLAFIFGSFVSGYMSQESDLDIAVFFKEVPDLTIQEELRERLSHEFGKEVDLVVLNTAPPIIKFQILKHGILIKKDEREYNSFFTQTIKEYDDLKTIRRETEKNLLQGRIYG